MEQLVDPAWLAGEMGAPDLRILDCSVVFERHDGVLTVGSGLSAWAEGHIPGSEHVDLVADLSDQASEMRFMMPPAAQFAAAMEGKGVGGGTRVVLYDDDRNMWAARVWWMLRAYGFDEAAVLDGGRRRWTVEGRELTVDPPVEHRAVFIPKPRSGLLVDKAAVLAATRDDGTCIVNALSAAHHNGESDDYGRRGHIPTSVNMPAADLVDPDTPCLSRYGGPPFAVRTGPRLARRAGDHLLRWRDLGGERRLRPHPSRRRRGRHLRRVDGGVGHRPIAAVGGAGRTDGLIWL